MNLDVEINVKLGSGAKLIITDEQRKAISEFAYTTIFEQVAKPVSKTPFTRKYKKRSLRSPKHRYTVAEDKLMIDAAKQLLEVPKENRYKGIQKAYARTLYENHFRGIAAFSGVLQRFGQIKKELEIAHSI
jgi:hypothetical protein